MCVAVADLLCKLFIAFWSMNSTLDFRLLKLIRSISFWWFARWIVRNEISDPYGVLCSSIWILNWHFLPSTNHTKVISVELCWCKQHLGWQQYTWKIFHSTQKQHFYCGGISCTPPVKRHCRGTNLDLLWILQFNITTKPFIYVLYALDSWDVYMYIWLLPFSLSCDVEDCSSSKAKRHAEATARYHSARVWSSSAPVVGKSTWGIWSEFIH